MTPHAGPAQVLAAARSQIADLTEISSQVETAVEAGHRTAAEVVAHVYADVDRSLWPAAELSVMAQLEYLREHGLT